ncbi:MAG: UvrD/REP helicase [Parcubacteria group bacterium GW2011_GWC2_42_12]|nr:MAG: UvrD/REP helicase [Parcubacteria group bacterium GW2011_GWC2_42_12]
MQQILDLHIHSKYSRSCSPELTLENIDAACRLKGVDIIATGDFTFPNWFSDIKNKLEETIPLTPLYQGGSKSGLYKLKSAKDDKVKFILSTEVALIYKDGGKARRIHIVIHASSIRAAEELNNYLDKNFNIRSDGRPILGLSAPDLMELCLGIDKKFLIYPAHIWTPWFAVFGSKSGFDKMEECFHEYTKDVYAIETGLSSDPAMNWRLSALDRFTILSNSDAHSLPNIAREANVFEMKETTYDEIYNIIKNKKISRSDNEAGVKYTIEFYPEEGMYHYDGHRTCQVSFTPEQTKKHKGICPVCKKPLVIGVMNRVDELADRALGEQGENTAPFKKLVELDKIIAEAMDIKSRHAGKVQIAYNNLVKQGGNELNILLNIRLKDLARMADAAVVEGIKRVREGKLIIKPGFDGQYGEIKIFSEQEKRKNKQKSLFE